MRIIVQEIAIKSPVNNKNTITWRFLCGSSLSFMINHIMHSKALYSRSTYEMNIQPFTLQETQAFLPKCSQREVMSAYLTIGGIPEYLKRIKNASSLLLGIGKHSFERDAFVV